MFATPTGAMLFYALLIANAVLFGLGVAIVS